MNHIYLKSLLEKAALEGDYAMIDYVDAHMQITTDRLIQPWKVLRNTKDELIVQADAIGSGFRQFAFSGIQKCRIVPLPEAMKILDERERNAKTT